MAHLLIAGVDAATERLLRETLEPRAHVADAAGSDEVAELWAHARAIQDPYDLLLIGADAPAALAALGPAQHDHAVVLVGPERRAEAASLGALGSLDPAAGVLEAFQAALARRERYLGRVESWEAALKYLDRLGAAFAEQRAAIAAHHERLQALPTSPASLPPAAATPTAAASEVPAHPTADPGEAAVMATLDALEAEATRAAAALPGTLDQALAPLAASFQATPGFWTTLRHLHAHQRIRCYALLQRLHKLATDRLAHGRAVAGSHFELPVGGDRWLTYRWAQEQRVLEGFVAEDRRAAELERLAHAPEPAVPLG